MRVIPAIPVWVGLLFVLLPSSPLLAGDRVGSCGGAGERACCFDEAIPSCDGDNVETSAFGGACGGTISGFLGVDAGSCVLNPQNPNNNTGCGGEGQRACCIGEASASCDAGLLELNPPGGTGLSCPGGAFDAGICFAATACGAPGQRACCTTEKGPGTPACNDDAAPLPGGIGAREYCGDATSAFLGLVPGATCVAVSQCGGIGQRACCSVPAETLALGKQICSNDGVELPGVTGDATCTDNIATTGAAVGTCITGNAEVPVNESGTVEPTTNWSPATTAPLPQGSLRGFADMHLHVLAHLAHGKQILAGYPAPVGPDGHVNPSGTPSASIALSAGDDIIKHGLPAHVPIVGDTVGFGTKDSTLSNFGWPYFNGWPSWNATTHQQVYYKWLERAWRGGMRLTTMLAVTNEAMCKSNNTYGTPDYDACSTSMTSILEQLQTVRDFEAFIDNQSGGPGLGWFRIVESPDEARDVIRAGQLAVVLGIEVDNLFGCKESGCPKVTRKDASGNVLLDADGNPALFDMDIQAEVDRIYAMGVRHVFPVHNFDNAFGAAATWQDIIGVGQAVSEGRWWQVRNCRIEGYGFSLSNLVMSLSALLGFNTDALPQNGSLPSNAGSGGATCNEYGLYGARRPFGDRRLGNGGRGTDLINALMNRGMIIDIDHMSTRSLDETLGIAQQRWAEYPLVASHVQFFDRHVQDFQPEPDLDEFGGGNAGRHERMRTLVQLQAIRDGGGMVAAMLKDDQQDGGGAGKQYMTAYQPQQGAPIPNNCVHSSKSFVQSYLYAVDTMGGPVAFGSDFNGIAGHLGPRFGSEACAATFDNPNKTSERLAQEAENNRVPYPFEMPGFGTLDRQVTGLKTFDYNTDGMAHVGLLPDFVKDLSQVGLSAPYMDAVFCSAERYIQVWERGVVISSGSGTLPDYSQMTCNQDVPVGDTTPPVSSASAAPAPTAAGWNNSAVTVTVEAQDEAGGSGLQMIAYAAGGASSFADSSLTSPATVLVTNEGTTLVTYFARDVAGNQEAKKSLQVRIDQTVPTITGSRTPAANAAGWSNAGVTASFLCADGLSGIATCSLPQTFTTEGSDQSALGTATDRAGNTATTTVAAINVDLTPPGISGAAAPAPNAAGWNNTNVVVTFTCTDALSGVASCTDPATLGIEGVVLSAGGTAVDNAGNTAATTVSGIKLDKTKPVVTVTGVAEGAVYTFGAVPVAGCDTSDALSGVATPATIQVTGGTSNGVGTFTATCGGALDVAGNADSKSATYRVQYAFRGFFSPVDNLPTMNVVTGGQAIPVKFDLGGDFGLDILASSSPVSASIACLTGALVDEIEETVTAGSSALTYSGGQYVYIWKTSKGWARTCRALQLKLDDGTTHQANFRFR